MRAKASHPMGKEGKEGKERISVVHESTVPNNLKITE